MNIIMIFATEPEKYYLKFLNASILFHIVIFYKHILGK